MAHFYICMHYMQRIQPSRYESVLTILQSRFDMVELTVKNDTLRHFAKMGKIDTDTDTDTDIGLLSPALWEHSLFEGQTATHIIIKAASLIHSLIPALCVVPPRCACPCGT